jgi:hypothetical protein
MARVPVNTAKQVTHALLECIVAMRAAKTAGRPKILERRRAESTPRGVALSGLHRLMHALEKIGDLRLRGLGSRLDSALSSAALAKVKQAHTGAFDLRQLNYRIPFLAYIADHALPQLEDASKVRLATHHLPI